MGMQYPTHMMHNASALDAWELDILHTMYGSCWSI